MSQRFSSLCLNQYWTTIEPDLYICPHDICHDKTQLSITLTKRREIERMKKQLGCAKCRLNQISNCIIFALFWCQWCKFNQGFWFPQIMTDQDPQERLHRLHFCYDYEGMSIDKCNFVGKGVHQVWEATYHWDKTVHYTLKCTSLSDKALERGCWQISNLREGNAIFNAVKH